MVTLPDSLYKNNYKCNRKFSNFVAKIAAKETKIRHCKRGGRAAKRCLNSILLWQDGSFAHFWPNKTIMLTKLLSASRFFILIAVAGQLLASVALLIDGMIKVVKITYSMLNGTVENKEAMIGFIETADLFLLAVALYIIALGLYDLFIDPNMKMPAWMNIKDLTDLKKKLLDVVVIILGVVFLGKVVRWNGETEILHFGVGIALVIAALTFFRKPGEPEKERD